MSSSDEEFIPEEEAEGSEVLKRLREKLKKAIEEKQEYLDGWQRARADFVNFKKEEVARERHAEERLKAEFAEALIPTLDSLERARQTQRRSSELELLEKQLLSSLKKFGIERFGEVGEEFDPHRHEALSHEGDANAVKSVERSGYQLGKKVIRPAQVTL